MTLNVQYCAEVPLRNYSVT